MHVCCQPDAWGGVVAAAIPDGRVALAWTRYAGEGGVFRVAGAVLDAGGEFHVFDPSPAAAGSEEPTGIAAWAGGDVAIARDTKEGEERVARVRWYAADGTPRAADTRLDPAAEAWAASIAALPDGRTVAVWVAPRGSAGGTTIVARAFAPDGTPGTAFVPAQWTFGDLDRPTVAAGGGGATFAWIRRFALGSDVWARPYTTAPAPAGDETLMNVHEGGTHDAPAAAARDGGSVVAWHASGSVPGVFFRFTGGSR
jgi:hypothetical protein